MKSYIESTALILFFAFFIVCPKLIGQTLSDTNLLSEEESSIFTTDKKFVYHLNLEALKQSLNTAPHWKKASPEKWQIIEIPISDARAINLKVAEAPIVEEPLYSLYPQHRSYKVQGLSKKDNIRGRIAITDKGLSGLLLIENKQIFIEALGGGKHISYEGDISMIHDHECGVTNILDLSPERNESRAINGNGNGSELREYIIAIGATNEFSAFRNNNLTTVNADIITFLNAANAFYEAELSITFTLCGNNNNVVFATATDPYDPGNKIASSKSGISSNLTLNEYDLGHVFSTQANNSGGSGVANVGAVCKVQGNDIVKAGAWTQAAYNISLYEYTKLWGHELGHQLGAPHSFYGTVGNCLSRSPGDGYEPGSGNSLMSYESKCSSSSSTCNGDHNVTPAVSSTFLHASSIDKILNYLNTQSCHNGSNTNNGIPSVSVPSNQSIPKGTPFELTATASDPDGDPVTFTWEQYDTDNLNVSCAQGHPDAAATSTSAPLFRSFDPSNSGYRSFPQKSDLSNNSQTMGEILPEVARNITMRATVRDNNPIGGAMNCDDVVITVVNTPGPFKITTANTSVSYNASTNISILWDVVNTDQAPINCTHVNILWSNDSGNSFPITLANNVSNDGSHQITMPSVGTSNGRLKIEAVGNIFYDINDADISILSSCNPSTSSIVNNETITADAGDSNLNFDLLSGQQIANLNGTVNSSNGNINLTVEDNNSCLDGNFPVMYNSHKIAFSQAGAVSFTSNATWVDIMNLYSPSINTNNSCENWLASSGSVASNGSIAHSDVLSASGLDAYTIHEFLIQSFPGNSAGDYTITFSGGGQFFDLGFLTQGFVHSYCVSNDAGTIVEIIDQVDLSDANTYSGGQYTIQGITYPTATDLSSYLNNPLSNLANDFSNGNICGLFSTNSKEVYINGGPCSPSSKMVMTGQDDNSINSLRMVIQNLCPGDTIVFDNNVNNISAINEISISTECLIEGNGKETTFISGLNSNRIFNVTNGAQLTLSKLNLSNGNALTNGGAIYINEGAELLFDDCILENNFEGATKKALTNEGVIKLINGILEIK